MTQLIIKSAAVRIGFTTALAIIAARILSLLVVYDFFHFDFYLTIVAISFFMIGYLLTTVKDREQKRLVDSDNVHIEDVKQILKSLSSRELSILEMIASGNTNKEIAIKLGIELSTVKTHINNLYVKTNCKNRKEAREKRNEWANLKLVS